MKIELRTAVSSFVRQLGTDLDYVLCTRRTGKEVKLRHLVDALSAGDGEGQSVTDIVNTLGVSSNPLTAHVVQIAKEVGLKFSGRGRGPTGDQVKAKLARLDASALIAARIAAVNKAKVPADEVPADEVPADEVLVDEVPADEVPADEVPADEVLVDEVPADESAEWAALLAAEAEQMTIAPNQVW